MQKVLLIEDNADYRLIIRRLLASYFDVDEAETLAQGIQLALGVPYYCILLDLGLPDSHWPETLKRFAEITKSPSIVIVSQHDDPNTIAQSIRDGAAGYLVKGRDDDNGVNMVMAIRRAVAFKRTESGLEEVTQILHDTAQFKRFE